MVALTYMLRYNFISFPAFAIATGKGIESALKIEKNGRSEKRLIITILFLANLLVSIYLPYYLRYVRPQNTMVDSYKVASSYIAVNSQEDDYVITNAPAFISYYSGRDCLLISGDISNLSTILKCFNKPFIVISLYEYQTDVPGTLLLPEIMSDKRFKFELVVKEYEKPVIYIFRAQEEGT